MRILLIFLCLFSFGFSNGLCFANELSDEEKRAFIESLATPSTEERVFYRWQSKEMGQKLLLAGEMTQELYEYFVGNGMYTKPAMFGLAGEGLYVAENKHSSSNYGESIVKVVVSAGYPFIDLEDQRIRALLRQKGISLSEAHRLKPGVAVKDMSTFGQIGKDNWWCLRKREGIQFKPVTNQELLANWRKTPLQLEKAGKYRFFSLLSKREQIELIHSSQNIIEAWEFLWIGRKLLSTNELSLVVSVALPLMSEVEYALHFLQIGWDYLLEEDRTKIIDKTLSFVQNKEDVYNQVRREFASESVDQVLHSFYERANLELENKTHFSNRQRSQVNSEIAPVPDIPLESLRPEKSEQRSQVHSETAPVPDIPLESLRAESTSEIAKTTEANTTETARVTETANTTEAEKVVRKSLTDHAIATAIVEFNKVVEDPKRRAQYEKSIRCAFSAFGD